MRTAPKTDPPEMVLHRYVASSAPLHYTLFIYQKCWLASWRELLFRF